MSISKVFLAGASLLVGSGCIARADIIQASLYGPPVPAGSVLTPILLSEISMLGATTTDGSAYSITFSVPEGQGVVSGSNAIHAIPVAGVSGATPEYLTGDYGSALTTNPALAGNYLSTGIGTITITFAAPQTSFALLWGSIDTGNSLTFNDAAGFVVTGTQVEAAASGFSGDGFQGPGGSAYVVVNSSTSFTTVTATSNVPSFEFADITGDSVSVTPAPEPSSFSLLVGGFVTLASLGLRRKRHVKL